jgi:nitrilase
MGRRRRARGRITRGKRMKNRQRVAAVQMATGLDVAANLQEAERLVREAAAGGAGLVVLPENFAWMGKQAEDQITLREADGAGPLQSFLARVASEQRVWLVGGTIPLASADPGRVRASCLVFDERGQRVGRYDKIHLFDVCVPGGDEQANEQANEHYQESATIEPGTQVVVIDSPWGRLGLAVCYDLRFPELFRRMLDQGVEIIAVPAAFTAMTGKAHWETLVRARAIENLVFVVAAAQGGLHLNGRETYGHSMVVDPWGTILTQLTRGTGCVLSAIEREFQGSVRRHFPSIDHRRLR